MVNNPKPVDANVPVTVVADLGEGTNMVLPEHNSSEERLDLLTRWVQGVEGNVNIADGFVLCRQIQPGSHAVSKDDRCTGNGFFKEGFKQNRAVAPIAQSVKKEFNLGNKVKLVCSKSKITVYHTNYSALKDAGSMTT